MEAKDELAHLKGVKLSSPTVRSASAVAVNRNGRLVAIGGRGIIAIYAFPTMEEVARLSESATNRIRELKWSPNAETLWCLSSSTLTRWEGNNQHFSPSWRLSGESSEQMLSFCLVDKDQVILATTKRYRKFKFTSEVISEVEWKGPIPVTPPSCLSENYLAIVGQKSLTVFENENGNVVLKHEFMEEPGQSVNLAISSDERFLAIGMTEGVVIVFDFRDLEKEPLSFSARVGEDDEEIVLKGLKWIPDSHGLITLNSTGEVCFWTHHGRRSADLKFALQEYRYGRGLTVTNRNDLFFVDDFGNYLYSLSFGVPLKFILFLRMKKITPLIEKLPHSLLKEMRLYQQRRSII